MGVSDVTSTAGPRALYKGDIGDPLVARFVGAGRVAWDIETSGLDPKNDLIGTVQLYAPGVGAIVVQMDSSPPLRLRGLLENMQVSKVFHHAMFDLRFMVSHWNVQPCNIYCTKVAAKLLDPRGINPSSLQHLLGRYLGVEISKDQRVTNWLSSSLTDEQLDYACKDVEYLLPLLDLIAADVERSGMTNVYRSCLRFLPARVLLDLGNWPDVFTY
jgi:ribonuclease D